MVNVMKNTPGWQVRAITRNPGSDASQALAQAGIEVVQADYDDEESLTKAFQVFMTRRWIMRYFEGLPYVQALTEMYFPQGVSAVFAVTNWWEHLFRGKTADEAGEIEEQQGMNLARAAARTESLEHYIWSTTPSAKKQFPGKHVTPHSKKATHYKIPERN